MGTDSYQFSCLCGKAAWARENVIGWYYRVTAYDASDVEELTVLE